MPYRRTPLVQARIDAQRALVLDAASALLADGGYAACTITAVAARAGIASGTVYSHFASKGELVADVFRTHVEREVEAVRSAARTGDAATRAATVVETFAGRALKHPRRAYALLAEPVDVRVDALRLEFRTAFRDLIAEPIRQGIAAGELPPQNASVVAAALVGAVAEALIVPLAAGRDDPDTVPALLEFTHRAIGGRRVDH